ncbi:hypothetical protein ACHHYP_14617 [Achlya hypogyna]|uniref:Transmembrane protein n=1 Tax=Achlya hypogyna TaxID=1202772 RepID=A0A1V9YCQ6_ACHHY|nr:hypothetical protein ACHHYP_14617 [Achlya hypogyna]
MVDLVMWGPCLIMLTLGGVIAFFADLLILYVTYPFDGSPASFAVIGALLMSCVDNTVLYISYVCATLRATKDHMSNRCIMFAMSRAGLGYAAVLFIVLAFYVVWYGDYANAPLYSAFVLFDGLNATMCSFLIGLWLCVRKKHKHIDRPTTPTKMEKLCMDSVIWPSIAIRYVYYLVAFSFVFLEKGAERTALTIGVYVGGNVALQIGVALGMRSFRRKVHRDAKAIENMRPPPLDEVAEVSCIVPTHEANDEDLWVAPEGSSVSREPSDVHLAFEHDRPRFESEL